MSLCARQTFQKIANFPIAIYLSLYPGGENPRKLHFGWVNKKKEDSGTI